jgi:hypothetical protein
MTNIFTPTRKAAIVMTFMIILVATTHSAISARYGYGPLTGYLNPVPAASVSITD